MWNPKNDTKFAGIDKRKLNFSVGPVKLNIN